MQKAYPPFSCQYSVQVPELLYKLNCSLVLSTYQAGKLIFLSPTKDEKIVQLPRHFEKVMGIAESSEGNKLALACKDEVIVFSNSPDLAYHYPAFPQKYDALYMPRLTYHTGAIDIHDLEFGKNESLYAVNTLFSCIIKLDDNYNFTPVWKPPFISDLVSEDRCHLNGMAMSDGKPKYVSAFGKGDSYQSWRENITSSGIIMDVERNEIIADNLGMPHTPRIFNGKLYCLLSATGELICIDEKTGKYDVVFKTEGFVRGMSLIDDYLFIGLSKLRKNSSTFSKLPFANKATESGILIVHLPSGSLAGKITYLSSLDELYDVHTLKGKLRPNILNKMKPDYKAGVMIPDKTFWAKIDTK